MPKDKGFFYRTLEAVENNILASLITVCVLSGLGTWTYKMWESHNRAEVDRARINAGIELKVGDYNGNEMLDRYYEIDGRKVPVEVDGKPVSDYFKR